MNKIFAALAVVLLSGCAANPIPLSSQIPESYRVSAKSVSVDDFSSDSPVTIGNAMGLPGWQPLYASFSPPLSAALTTKMRGSLLASGADQQIDIRVTAARLAKHLNHIQKH